VHYGRSRFGSWELGEQYAVGVVDSKFMKETSKDDDNDMKRAYSVIHKGEKLNYYIILVGTYHVKGPLARLRQRRTKYTEIYIKINRF
jgi:hypothetical protein